MYNMCTLCIKCCSSSFAFCFFAQSDDSSLHRKHVHVGSAHGLKFQVEFLVREVEVSTSTSSVFLGKIFRGGQTNVSKNRGGSWVGAELFK